MLVANLPYNIATPLIADLLDAVAVRRAHGGHGAAGGRASGWPRAVGDPRVRRGFGEGGLLGEASVVGRVPPSVFVPRPKVDSALVSIRRRPSPAVDPEDVARRVAVRAWSGPASPTGARCSGVRSPVWCPRPRSSGGGVSLRVGRRSSTCMAWGRLAAATAAAAGVR